MFPKHLFTARITRPNSSKVNKFNKQQRVIQVTAAERTRGRDEPAQITRGNYTERGTFGTLRNSRNITFQAL